MGLRRISEETHQNSLRQFVEMVVERSKENCLLFDGHYVVFDQHKHPVLKISDWISKFDLLILVTAPVENIYYWMLKDHTVGSRDRSTLVEGKSDEIIKMIEYRQKITINTVKLVSEWFNVDYIAMENNGNVKEVANNIVQLMEKYKGDSNEYTRNRSIGDIIKATIR